MCTSFNLGGNILNNIDNNFIRFERKEYYKYINKDIYPNDKAIVIKGEDNKKILDILNFGYKGYDKNSLILNARSEGVFNKKTFRIDFRNNRVVIPMSKFYEWNYLKERSEFFPLEDSYLFACGFTNGKRFVILTKDANEIVSPIHKRMPLLIGREKIDDWIFNDKLVRDILKEDYINLKRRSDFEQISFL